MRKTIVIELVVDNDLNQQQMRDKVQESLNTNGHPLREALKSELGWTGNPGSCGYTVSNPKRTAHWDT